MSYDKVIVALDYENPEKAYRLVDEIGDRISWFKVGPVLFTRSGIEVIQFLHKRSKKIFLDMKLHDTPNVVAETVKQFADMGVQFATVHCIGGRKMLEAASTGCRGSRLQLLGVTVLTSHGSAQTMDWAPLPEKDSTEKVGMMDRLIQTAVDARLSGILCSPHEISQVRERTLPGFILATPGIRLPKEEIFMDDQQRVASPKEAVAWGADFLIVGRPVTLAREPREVIDRLFA